MRPVFWFLFALSALGAGLARERLVDAELAGSGEKELLYLPNGKYLRAVSLGNAPVVADFVYLWAIQYYSDYEREDRYRYVQHVFGDVIGQLDPAFTDPYWIGALILTTEANDLDGGLKLLDTGFQRDPSAWLLPFLAGWECERFKQFDRAAAYFDRAAHAPGAPREMARLEAGMIAREGKLRDAIAEWKTVLHDPQNDDGARAIAERQIRTLTVRADLQDLDAAIAEFRQRTGRNPRALGEVVRAGVLGALPLDPDGKPYVYDPATATASSTAGRLLGP
jgi:tetratricopeptide (TPR) repeat protein